MLSRAVAHIAIAALASLVGAASSLAQSYPSRPISLIVPWGAGGGTDTLARSFAAHLERELKATINIVNRTGGSGVVGHSAIANAAPDGYTLGLATIEITTFKTIGLADLTPADLTTIAHLAVAPAGLTVRADSEYKTAAEALEAIKKSPKGQFTGSGTGQGGSWHFALAGLLRTAGLPTDQVRWVPSQGGAPALQEVTAGGITFFTGSPAEAKSLLAAKRVRSLAVMHPKRVAAFSDIPTLAEVTGSKWTMGSPYGLVGPKGLPDDIKGKVLAAAEAAFKNPEFQKFLEERGYAPEWLGPDAYAASLAESAKTLGALAADLGLAKK